jgi:mono/diheme cytochrome c family protein
MSLNVKFISAVLLAGSVLFLGVAKSYTEEAKLDGKELFKSEKFKCFTCHGENGKGGRGPAFTGYGKKYLKEELMQKAAHNCPPTGACDPKQLGAIVDYIRTL